MSPDLERTEGGEDGRYINLLFATTLPRSRVWWAGQEFFPDLLVFLLAISPLLLTAHIPLSDLPNHLARQYVLRDLARDPILQEVYTVHWELVPNLALELFVVCFRNFVSIDFSVRLFCISTVALLFFGARLANLRLSDDKSRIYRCVPLLVYGGPFQFGFLSYCFGIGLGLLLFGSWLKARHQRIWNTMPVFLIGAFALLLSHIAAFGILAIAIGGYEIGEALGMRRSGWRPASATLFRRGTRAFASLTPAFLLFILLSPMAHSDGTMRWSTLQQRLESTLAITVFSAPYFEAALLSLSLIGLVAAFATGVVRLHPNALPMLGVLVLAWLALPRSGFGGGYIDYRVPWAISLYLLVCLVPATRDSRFRTPLAYSFGILTAARVALIAILWLNWEPVLSKIDAAFENLPVGARMMVVIGQLSSTSLARRPSLLHVAAYAVARRQAFEPEVYAGIAGQILDLTPEFARLRTIEAPSVLTTVDPLYDHLLVIYPDHAKLAPSIPLSRISAGPEFALYRIDRDSRSLDRDGVPTAGDASRSR